MAAAALRGLAIRRREQVGTVARLSLARTALSLTRAGEATMGEPYSGPTKSDWDQAIEQTAWGPARRLLPPVAVGNNTLIWDLPASALGSAEAKWQYAR